MKQPILTFPKKVSDYVREAYAQADCILEYGSGGSTVLAAEMPGKTIYSVESDLEWMRALQDYLNTAETVLSMPRMHHADIGKTVKWGRPENDSQWRKYHQYSIDIWNQPDFNHPDLVLIDGRFRPSCFYASVLMATKPMTVLFDDFTERPHYFEVKTLFEPVETIERMAVFKTTPLSNVPRANLKNILSSFNAP